MDLFTRLQRRANRRIQSQPWVLFATAVLAAGAEPTWYGREERG